MTTHFKGGTKLEQRKITKQVRKDNSDDRKGHKKIEFKYTGL